MLKPEPLNPSYPGSPQARASRIAAYRSERLAAHIAAGHSQAQAAARAAADDELQHAAEAIKHPRGLCVTALLGGN
jgi:hypothetical protein